MKILIVKIAAIGDVVMALPLLTHIRSRYPQGHITWICGKQVRPLLNATGLVDRLISIDESSLYKGSAFRRFWSVLRVWFQIAGGSYDLCITGHPDPRYRWISFPIFCKERRFFDRLDGRSNPVPGRYHANEYFRLLTGMEISENTAPVFPKLVLPLARKLADRPVVAISPGGAKNALSDDALRRWPIDSYAQLAEKLSALPVEIALTGGESDSWVKSYFRAIPHIDMIGKLDLLDFIAFLKHCNLLITHDSGPLHLAKLAGCPVIALFGPTMPSEKVSPGEKIKVLWGGERLPCRPCYDGKAYANCKNNLCLRSISSETVFNEAVRALGDFSC